MARLLTSPLAPLFLPPLLPAGDPRLAVFAAAVAGGGGNTNLPIVAWIGPSTAAQGISPLSNQFRQQSISPIKIAQGLHPYFECMNWYDDTRPNNNGGFIMAQDGWTMATDMDGQVAYVANSDASIVVLESGRNDVPNMTAAAYYAAAKALLLSLQALPNIDTVFWVNLWMRTTASGVGWGSGEANRTRLLDINTEMNTWCPANGIEVIDLYTALTDPGDPDENPYAYVTRGDGIHFTPKGAHTAGVEISSALALIISAGTPYDPALAGNLARPLEGTGGTLGTGCTGEAPDGWTLSRASNTTPVTAPAGTLIAPGEYQIAWDTTAIVDADGEQATLSTTTDLTGFEVGKWYVAKCEIEVSAGAGFCGAAFYFGEDTPEYSIANMPVNDGGAGITANDSAALLEPQSYTRVLETDPWQFGTTEAIVSWRFRSFADASTSTFTISRLDIREVTDPTLKIGPVITSAAAYDQVGDGVSQTVINLTASKAVTWSIDGGADAAAFDLVSSTLTPDAQTFGADNDRVVIVRATDAGGKTATQTITLTITDPLSWITPAGVANGSLGTSIDVSSGDITLVLPSNVADGHVLVAAIASRSLDGVTLFATPSGWTASPANADTDTLNNASGATTSMAALQVYYCIYDELNPPDLTFTRTGGNQARGWIICRDGGLNPTFQAAAGLTNPNSTTAVANPGVTTVTDNSLVFNIIGWARITNGTGCDATDPSGASGAGDPNIDPVIGTWTERRDNSVGTAPGVGVGMWDAVKATPGATGTITVTTSNGARHASQSLCFNIGT